MKEQERVLAYNKAKIITHEELAEIAGGMGHSANKCSEPSGQVYLNNGRLSGGGVDWRWGS